MKLLQCIITIYVSLVCFFLVLLTKYIYKSGNPNARKQTVIRFQLLEFQGYGAMLMLLLTQRSRFPSVVVYLFTK